VPKAAEEAAQPQQAADQISTMKSRFRKNEKASQMRGFFCFG
jgi:hypothetical protein